MKISASIYSGKNRTLKDTVSQLDKINIDYLHVDSIERVEVFEDIRQIRKYSRTPIDLHIISEEPDKFIPLIEEHNIELVSFQYEQLNSSFKVPKKLRSKVGLAIHIDTNIEEIKPFISEYAFILLMMTTPGISGGKFNFEKLAQIQKYREEFPNKPIHVDGGVNNYVSAALRKLDIDCIISGSFLVNSETLGLSLLQLRSGLDFSNYVVEDFCYKLAELPILHEKELSLKSMLQMIGKFKFGFCLIIDEENRLTGVATDGDIRREMLNNIEDLSKMSLESIVNRTPVSIESDEKMIDIIMRLGDQEKKVNFLPIVSNDGELRGAITINQIFRGKI